MLRSPRRVVAPDGLDLTGAEPLPQCRLVRRGSQRWSAGQLGCFESAGCIALVAEDEIDRPRLDRNARTAGSRRARRLQRVRAREVHDVDLGSSELRIAPGALRRLRLRQSRTALREVPRVAFTCSEERPSAVVKHVAVLGVDVDHRAGGAACFEHAQQPAIANAEFVDHEHLEARVSVRDDRGHLGDALRCRLRQHDVKAVVDVRFTTCLRLPRFDGVVQPLAGLLPRVVADGGDAAACGGGRARLEVIG